MKDTIPTLFASFGRGALTGTAQVSMLLILTVSGAASGENLILDPTFESAVDNWVPNWVQPGYYVLWSDSDAQGSSSSGSAVVHGPGGMTMGGVKHRGCFTIDHWTEYQLESEVMMPSGQEVSGHAQLLINWYSDSGCNNLIFPVNSTPWVSSADHPDEWVSGSWRGYPPSGARSAAVFMQLSKQQPTGEFISHFDNLFFGFTSEIQGVFFDDFDGYDCVMNCGGENLIGPAVWMTAEGAMESHQGWWGLNQSSGSRSMESGVLTLEYSGSAGVGPGYAPEIATRAAHNRGTYVARVRFSDSTGCRSNPYYQTFWIQNAYTLGDSTSYAECDYEYHADVPRLDLVTWECVTCLPIGCGQRNDCDAQPYYWGSLWFDLIIRVDPDTNVVYEILEDSGAQWYRYSLTEDSTSQNPGIYVPESGSKMQIMLNVWAPASGGDENGPLSLSGPCSMEVDWVLFLADDTETSYFDLVDMVNGFRDLGLTRVDAIDYSTVFSDGFERGNTSFWSSSVPPE